MTPSPPTPLPVTGYANVNALGSTRAEILAALEEGRTGLLPPDDSPGFETTLGAVRTELPELPDEMHVWSTRMARMAALLVGQLEEPLRHARARWRPERIAVLLGTSTAGAETTEKAFEVWVRDGALPAEYDFRKQHTFGAALHVIAALTGARGPAWTISTACTSGAKPLASAQRLIASGMVDAAIVGGIDTLCSLTLQGFHALQALDRQPCRPFSAERSGLSLGEGGVLALVEREGEARVLVEAVGETSDAYHISAPHPEGRGALEAMRSALEQAGCKPGDVDHINAHGTGTPLNDVAESAAISALFGNDVPVVSTKGYTGHTLGAAGAIEFAFSAYAIEEGWIPASLNADPVDPKVDVNVSRRVERGVYKRVLSNSFAFGGSNVSVLLRAP
ncbi:MAG: beta-ketoacyl-ACP synthase [Planctomycetota bacterium]|jgi:3-oxoacyl-[acyl-carrier-protein] synthase-1